MPSFLTQCPHCLTSFRVTDSQLEAADGLVRCGACLGIFSAAANRITLKQTPEEAAAAASAEAEPEVEGEIEPDYADAAEDEFEFDEDDEEFVAVPDDDVDETVAETTAAESYEFVVPDLPEEEPEPVAVSRREPEPAPAHEPEPEPDHDVLDQEDFDIPLGDLNLDIDDIDDLDDAPDEGEYEEESDDEFDEPEDEAEEEFEPQDEAELLATANEAFGIARQHERDDQDADDEEYEEEEEDEELSPPVTPGIPASRITTDKTELRRHLAELEDDEALEPLDDEDLDFEEEPVMLDSAPRRGWLATSALILGNVLLIGVLALQYADANIAALDRSAGFAPFKPYVCRVVECPPPERSQLDRLVSEQLLVRSHPRYAQALEVNLVFRNDAAESQPFPAIELGFHDTSNRLLANRLFQPAEYLPTELRTSDMPARSSYQVQFEMVDPGSEAVNYTLTFRKP